MTTLNDYFLAGRKALERWRPELQARLRRAAAGPGESRLDAAALDLEMELPENELGQVENAVLDFGPNSGQPWPPALATLLAQVRDLPPYCLTLGACEDGLPFLLDLNYPAPGALLLCGDVGSGKTRFLRALAASAVTQNKAEQVQISVLAQDPEAYMQLAEAEHCQEIFPVDDPSVTDLIRDLSSIMEERRHGRPEDPALLLIIDGLAECLASADGETFERLYRLVRHGARSRVWTIASLDTRQAQAIDNRLLASFRTRLLGRIRNRHTAENLAGETESIDTRDLESGLFLMPYGGEWLRLWACQDPDELNTPPQEDDV